IDRRLVRACHDLSEGGLAVALAEMAFAGGIGVKIELGDVPGADDTHVAVRLFSESNTRFLCEVAPEHSAPFEQIFDGLPLARIGESTSSDRFIASHDDKTPI